jgi:hypothetical protein
VSTLAEGIVDIMRRRFGTDPEGGNYNGDNAIGRDGDGGGGGDVDGGGGGGGDDGDGGGEDGGGRGEGGKRTVRCEVADARAMPTVPDAAAAVVGLALVITSFCSQNTVQLMTDSMVHVINLTPGSECNPTRRWWTKARWTRSTATSTGWPCSASATGASPATAALSSPYPSPRWIACACSTRPRRSWACSGACAW